MGFDPLEVAEWKRDRERKLQREKAPPPVLEEDLLAKGFEYSITGIKEETFQL